MILSHLLFTQPFVIIVVYARMLSFDWRVVESARDLGASPLRAFLTVTLPIIQPTVIGAALIAVALSIDDFVITFFTIGSGNTLPTFVWGMIRTALRPTVNAIGTLIILLTIGSTLIALWLTKYRGDGLPSPRGRGCRRRRRAFAAPERLRPRRRSGLEVSPAKL